MKGRVVLGLIGAVASVALIAVLASFGLPPSFLAAWILLIVAVGVASRNLFDEDEPSWPPARPSQLRGSAISRLAWTINRRTGVVAAPLVRRVRSVVDHRLALRGLDLDDETHHARIDELVGPGLRTTLTAREIRREELDRVLDAMDRLPPELERE